MTILGDTDRGRQVVVREVVHEADGVVSLHLGDPSGLDLPTWCPGAHVDLVLGPDLVRQYSLCGDPGDLRHYRLGVLREPTSRGGSARVHEAVRAGHALTIAGPRNNFELAPAKGYVFIAGGIGITPLLPMVATAHVDGADWRLLYGGRRRASMAFLDELARYGDRVEVVPQDECGLLDLDNRLAGLDPEVAVYCCGPEPLIAAVEAVCAREGVDGLHVERFSTTRLDPALADSAIEVQCARSGVTVEVSPGQTILDALRGAGVEVESVCEEGVCGTCETRVLEGRPDHRDSVLSPSERAEGTTMMICRSRALGPRLVLDR